MDGRLEIDNKLIESCSRRRVDPWKYLVCIIEELPKVKVTAGTFASYTPAAYAQKLHAESRALKVS